MSIAFESKCHVPSELAKDRLAQQIECFQRNPTFIKHALLCPFSSGYKRLGSLQVKGSKIHAASLRH